MNNTYNEDILLEKKSDDDDDGLLSHGLVKKKKENPHYTDYKNQQIMSGKAVKSEEGWKKDEKRKRRLKRLVGGVATIGAAVGAAKLYKDNKDPVARAAKKAAKIQEKTQAKDMIGQAKAAQIEQKRFNQERTRLAKKNGIKAAKIENKNNKIIRKANQKKDRDASKEIARDISMSENLLTTLMENFTEEQINNYFNYYNESSDQDKEQYLDYKKAIKNTGGEPMSFKEWKAKKYKAKRTLKKVAVGAGILATAGLAVHSAKSNNKSISNKIRDLKTNRAMKNSNDRLEQNDKIVQNNKDNWKRRLNEEFDQVSSSDIVNYLEALDNNVNFSKNSYERYCVMMESKGLTPLDENAFEAVKKSALGYVSAAKKGVTDEIIRRKADAEEAKKKREEKKRAEKEAEKAKIERMSPVERENYLAEKRKKEKKELEKDDYGRTFKSAFLRGSGEQLGKTVVKMVSGGISR